MTKAHNQCCWINPAAAPSPEAIQTAREATGLTEAEAGGIVYSSTRDWQQWESGEKRLHPAIWELFCLKAPQGTWYPPKKTKPRR